MFLNVHKIKISKYHYHYSRTAIRYNLKTTVNTLRSVKTRNNSLFMYIFIDYFITAETLLIILVLSMFQFDVWIIFIINVSKHLEER